MANLVAVREAMDELEDLATMAIAATERFGEAVGEVAKKAEMEKSVVRAFVMAKVRDKLREFETKQEQMDLLFNEVAHK
jgi:hypothetical protein